MYGYLHAMLLLWNVLLRKGTIKSVENRETGWDEGEAWEAKANNE